MALTSINRPFERAGRGDLFLAAYPSADVGTTFANRVDGFFAIFYTDGAGRKTLKGGVNPWCNMEASGINVKAKQNTIEYDPNNAPKHPVGIQDSTISAEFMFADVDPAHLADAFNLTTAELIAMAAVIGKAGRSTAVIGGQSILNKLVAMYRMPSILVPGEYDHYLIPRVVIAPDTEIKLSKKEVVTCKLVLSALPDVYLLNADGFPEVMIADIANAAGL